MKPINENEAYWISVYWNRWRTLNRFLDNPRDDDANLYAIWAKFGSGARLAYIGKVYDQYAGFRLGQHDHGKRLLKIKRRYPRHEIMISLGEIQVCDGVRVSRKRVDEIERLLIYANEPQFNVRNMLTHGASWDYRIESKGSYGIIHRVLHYGLFRS